MRYKAALLILAAISVNAFAGQGSGGGLGKLQSELELLSTPSLDLREILLPVDDMRRLKARLSISESAEVQTEEGLILAKKLSEKIVDSSLQIEFISQ